MYFIRALVALKLLLVERWGPERAQSHYQPRNICWREGKAIKGKTNSFLPFLLTPGVDLPGLEWEAPLGFGRVGSRMAAGFPAVQCQEDEQSPRLGGPGLLHRSLRPSEGRWEAQAGTLEVSGYSLAPAAAAGGSFQIPGARPRFQRC